MWPVAAAVITLVSFSPLSRPHGFSLALFGWLGLSGLILLGGEGWAGMESAETGHLRFPPVLKAKLSAVPQRGSSYRQAVPRCPRHGKVDFVSSSPGVVLSREWTFKSFSTFPVRTCVIRLREGTTSGVSGWPRPCTLEGCFPVDFTGL